jgi:hypothetical protein
MLRGALVTGGRPQGASDATSMLDQDQPLDALRPVLYLRGRAHPEIQLRLRAPRVGGHGRGRGGDGDLAEPGGMKGGVIGLAHRGAVTPRGSHRLGWCRICSPGG